jgi:hypothetical protein
VVVTAKRNLYGCLPCPLCRSVFRCAYGQGRVTPAWAVKFRIECDDCGLVEPAVATKEESAGSEDWGFDAVGVGPSRLGLLWVLKQRAGFAWQLVAERIVADGYVVQAHVEVIGGD